MSPTPRHSRTPTSRTTGGQSPSRPSWTRCFPSISGGRLDLFRIYRAGGGRIEGNDVPEPLACRLADEVERIATRVFNMCWRAVDYVPPVYCALGDFLRACITADTEYMREDPWGLRDAIMQAFRMRGIHPPAAPFFSEDTLRWPVVDTRDWVRPGLDTSRLAGRDAANELAAFVTANAQWLGSSRKAQLAMYPLETARMTAPDDTPKTIWSTQVVEAGRNMGGKTLVFDSSGRLRYAIDASTLPKRAQPNRERVQGR